MMSQKIVPWVDPVTNEPLVEENNFLISNTSKYQIYDGIPNFVLKIDDPVQQQVQKSFGDKWTKSDFGQNDDYFNEKIKNIYLEMMGLNEQDFSIFENKILLDVGIGSGSSARLWAPRAKEFHGIDISKAVYRAKYALQSSVRHPILSQADLNFLPYQDEIFEAIVSNGVFHHAPDTKLALKNVIKKLKPGGICLFYIYKKKSPIREFADDYIRSKISNLPHDLAWNEMKSITNFAKSLHDQYIKISIKNNIEILGIKKGEYDLQRFIYQYFFKCFWNESWGYDYSNLVNFDWYHPKFSWRHTEKEIRDWCKEFHLDIQYLKESESGYSCLIVKD
ncbi:MAG: class I SAM-dependent methyltransferase [Nitrosopumilaceae archaeon]